MVITFPPHRISFYCCQRTTNCRRILCLQSCELLSTSLFVVIRCDPACWDRPGVQDLCFYLQICSLIAIKTFQCLVQYNSQI